MGDPVRKPRPSGTVQEPVELCGGSSPSNPTRCSWSRHASLRMITRMANTTTRCPHRSVPEVAKDPQTFSLLATLRDGKVCKRISEVEDCKISPHRQAPRSHHVNPTNSPIRAKKQMVMAERTKKKLKSECGILEETADLQGPTLLLKKNPVVSSKPLSDLLASCAAELGTSEGKGSQLERH